LENKLSSENNQLSSEHILGLLPHRYPFALVDKVIENIPGERAVAVKNVTINEPQFQGHFPERPLMPGVLIVESMAQVGGIIVTQMPDLPKGLFVFAGINNVKFRKPVVPGDQLIISCELLSIKRQNKAVTIIAKGRASNAVGRTPAVIPILWNNQVNKIVAIVPNDIQSAWAKFENLNTP